jgi:hypothetical protein
MPTLPEDWPSPLTLLLEDSELQAAVRLDDPALARLTLASAQVQWASTTQRQPQRGWVWPLTLHFMGVEVWEASDLQPGRIASAQLQREGADVQIDLTAPCCGPITLALQAARGGRLFLRAEGLQVDVVGAQWRESLAC